MFSINRYLTIANRYLTIALVVFTANASSAAFIGFDGTASTYNDGTTDWQVVDVYALYDGVGGTEALLHVFNADITTSDSLGFNHSDLASGNWKPSFSFEILPIYDPEKDSYVTIGYGVGALAALNLTSLDPVFGSGNGPFIPSGGGYYNQTPSEPQFAVSGSVHVGHFVWDSARSNGNEENFFSYTAQVGYDLGPGTEDNFGSGSYVWESASVIPEPSTALLMGLGLAGLAGVRRR